MDVTVMIDQLGPNKTVELSDYEKRLIERVRNVVKEIECDCDLIIGGTPYEYNIGAVVWKNNLRLDFWMRQTLTGFGVFIGPQVALTEAVFEGSGLRKDILTEMAKNFRQFHTPAKLAS